MAMAWLVTVAACGKTDEAWENAVRTDTPDAYASFLERHPKSEYAEQARTRRDALIDERDWSAARRENTAAAYAKYLSVHPEGVWSELAARRQKELAPATEAAEMPAAEAPVAAVLPAVVPTPTAAPAVPVQAPAAKRFVQLGAFSSEAAARKGWTRLQRSFVELADLSPVISPEKQKGSSLYRLRVQLDGDEEADRICAVLVRGGAECIKLN